MYQKKGKKEFKKQRSERTLSSISTKDLKTTYNEISDREQFCSGCGQNQYLSRSHIIRRSLDRQLIADPDNIVFDCTYRLEADEFGNKGCHERWESMEIKQMLTLNNFKQRLDYVEKHNLNLFNKISGLLNGR